VSLKSVNWKCVYTEVYRYSKTLMLDKPTGSRSITVEKIVVT